MALHLFASPEHPHGIAVTKAGLPMEECVFLLDFSRPLQKLRWFGAVNEWLGFTVDLSVPVVHQSEMSGGFVIGVRRGEPYFSEIQDLWKNHYGSARMLVESHSDAIRVVADFGTHFPQDC